MSPETATQDRIYLAVKRDYWEGKFWPTERVDIRAIADRHITSPTPVREVLSRFVGERLFEHRTEGGFWPATPTSDGLRDLYTLYRDLIRLALASADTQRLRGVLYAHRARAFNSHPFVVSHATASFFDGIAEASANRELGDLIHNLNERLLLVRAAEAMVLDGVEQEMRAMTRNGLVDIRSVIGKRVARYHARRIDRVDEIVNRMCA